MDTTPRPRPLYCIAAEIVRDWRRPYFGAKPYLSAMLQLTSISDRYGLDGADSVIRYFLANASTWRGETARRVKAELRTILGEGRRA